MMSRAGGAPYPYALEEVDGALVVRLAPLLGGVLDDAEQRRSPG